MLCLDIANESRISRQTPPKGIMFGRFNIILDEGRKKVQKIRFSLFFTSYFVLLLFALSLLESVYYLGGFRSRRACRIRFEFSVRVVRTCISRSIRRKHPVE